MNKTKSLPIYPGQMLGKWKIFPVNPTLVGIAGEFRLAIPVIPVLNDVLLEVANHSKRILYQPYTVHTK